MQIADSCLDSPQMSYSGIWSVHSEKDHDMCDNNRNKECYVVRKVMCVFEGVSRKEYCIGMVAHVNCKESWSI